MKLLINARILRCMWQRRLDNVLALLSFVVITVLLVHFYRDRLIILVPYVALAWAINVGVMMYCRQLWTIRITKWENINQWCRSMDNVEKIFTSACALPTFPKG